MKIKKSMTIRIVSDKIKELQACDAIKIVVEHPSGECVDSFWVYGNDYVDRLIDD